jgi:hypothetical protein
VIGRFFTLLGLLAGGAPRAIAGCAPPAPAAPAPPAPEGPGSSAPRLAWKARGGDASRSVVEVGGADPIALDVLRSSEMSPERWRSFLTVKVVREGAAAADDTPALLGTYRVDGPTLRFEPRFPLERGVRYRAEFDPVKLHEAARSHPSLRARGERKPATTAKLTADFSLPERALPPTTIVTAVYPTRATLPENLLRFYIHFSAPMSRGEAYRHVRLLDAAGKPVEDPFLELDEELWSGDGQRFTLLFDPGRIKRGLRPREEVGPILEAGRSYELVIDAGWTDAAGTPLKAGFRKKFRAGPADEASPDPKTWVIRPPAPGTREPLEVRFPEPLDRALLGRLIAVHDGADTTVRGNVAVAEEETLWRFAPVDRWRPGAYRLVIGTDLEDVAGNSVARPFEVDVVRPISRRIVGETIARPFPIDPASR